MRFEHHWAAFTGNRPRLNEVDVVVEINAKNLKSLMQQAYEKGYADGKKDTIPFDFLEKTIFGEKQ